MYKNKDTQNELLKLQSIEKEISAISNKYSVQELEAYEALFYELFPDETKSKKGKILISFETKIKLREVISKKNLRWEEFKLDKQEIKKLLKRKLSIYRQINNIDAADDAEVESHLWAVNSLKLYR